MVRETGTLIKKSKLIVERRAVREQGDSTRRNEEPTLYFEGIPDPHRTPTREKVPVSHH